MAAQRQPYVFISYARRDGREFADQLAKELRANRFEIWIDREQLDVGEEGRQRIDQAIREAIAILIILTPGALESNYIFEIEIPRSRRYKKPIIPLLFGDITEEAIPSSLRQTEYLDFRKDFGRSFRRLIRTLEGFRAETGNVSSQQAESANAGQNPPPPNEGATSQAFEIPPPPPGEPTLDAATLIRALTDEATLVDLLGFQDYAAAIAGFIRYQREQERQKAAQKTTTDEELPQKPLVIGIDAPWGTGKTSLMYMIEAALNTLPEATTPPARSRLRKILDRIQGKKPPEVPVEKPFITVWFNAWKYDQEESLWAALALQILDQIPRKISREQHFRLRASRFDFKKLSQTVIRWLVYAIMVGVLGLVALWAASTWAINGLQTKDDPLSLLAFLQRVSSLFLPLYGGSAVTVIGVFAVFMVGVQIYNRFFKSFDLKLDQYVRQPNYGERVGFLAEFDSDFKKIVDVVTEKGRRPLVVFIDDLDRCAPPKSTEIIEAINILIDSRHCVYIIGMDSRAVAASIETKYKELKEFYESESDPGGLTLGQQFLEKIIQISFRIPKVTETTINPFIRQHLGSQIRDTEGEIGAATPDEAGETDGGAKPVELAREAEELLRQFEEWDEVQEVTKLAAENLGYNPRKIKRFLNEFRLRAAIASQRGLIQSGAIQLDVLGKWIIVNTRWPDFIELVIDEPAFYFKLLNAVIARQNWRQAQSASPPTDPDDVKKLKLEMGQLFTDPNVRRFVNAEKLLQMLFDLIQGINGGDELRAFVSLYLYLPKPTLSPAS